MPISIATLHGKPLPTDSTAATTSHDEAALATAWIEISRGRTLYPRRPIAGERFLIGAGSNCHLQLGGHGMPFLHSLIVRSDQSLTIEAFAAHPELRINGAVVRTAELRDGDRLEIGLFELTLHRQASVEAEPSEPLYAPIPLDLADEPAPRPASELSAAELAAQIEAHETAVAEFDDRQRSGVAALLQAARHAAAVPEETAAEENQLLEELSTLSLDLEQRLAELRQREDAQRLRAESLLSAQDRLAEQLKLAAQSLAQQQDRVRASA
jgi:hypothetical protein